MAVSKSLAEYRKRFRNWAHRWIPADPPPITAYRIVAAPRKRIDRAPVSLQRHALSRSPGNGCDILPQGAEAVQPHIERYVQEVPFIDLDGSTADAERFLGWLGGQSALTAEDQDVLRWQYGRQAVEFVAVRQRLAHVRFQRLLAMPDRPLPGLDTSDRTTLHLNPIHVWSRFVTRTLLDDDEPVPATVLFFPVGDEIRTAALEPECERLVRYLEQHGVLRLRDLRRWYPHQDSSALLTLLRELAETGMLALGPAGPHAGVPTGTAPTGARGDRAYAQ